MMLLEEARISEDAKLILDSNYLEWWIYNLHIYSKRSELFKNELLNRKDIWIAHGQKVLLDWYGVMKGLHRVW